MTYLEKKATYVFAIAKCIKQPSPKTSMEKE
jgi:hypothetical protein